MNGSKRDSYGASGRIQSASVDAGSGNASGIGASGAHPFRQTPKPSGEVLSGAILSALQATYPDVRTKRWRRPVLAAFLLSSRRYGFPVDFRDMIKTFRFEPDAYTLDKAERWLHFFEVEVYNPMTEAKLRAYAKLQRDFDYYGIEFCVLVVNKYGHINEVGLSHWEAACESA